MNNKLLDPVALQELALEERMREINVNIQAKRKIYQQKIKKIADAMPSKPNYIPTMAKFIERASIEDDCNFYMIYGPLRYGKTSYACKTLASIYDSWNPQILKRFIVFKPMEFIQLKKTISTGIKYPCFLWDDAGVHLSAMHWNDPLLKKVTDYFQTIGTHFNAVIFTTPLPAYVVKKLRGMPNSVNIRIYKLYQHANKMRIAKGYYQWLAPDQKKSGVKPIMDDRFSAILPTQFYDWYLPHRQKYADESFNNLEQELYAQAEETLSKEPEPKQFNEDSKFYNKSVEELANEDFDETQEQELEE